MPINASLRVPMMSVGVARAVHGGIAGGGSEAARHATRRPIPLRRNPLRVGRRSNVAEEQAIGGDGKLAIIARMTGHRC
jgi:hypothetical protein